MPLFSVATLYSSDLQMKEECIDGRKENPEGREKKNHPHLNPHKQFSLSILKHLLELDDPARNYSRLQAWQHTRVTLKKKVLILADEKGKNTRSNSEEKLNLLMTA